MLRTKILAGFIAALLISPAAFAQEQGPPCGTYVEISTLLKERHGETLRVIAGMGKKDSGIRLEIWRNDEKQTWTSLMVKGNKACMERAGYGWYESTPVENKFDMKIQYYEYDLVSG